MPFCTNCGSELREGDLFCAKCGAPVRPVQQSASTGAPAQGQPTSSRQGAQQQGVPQRQSAAPVWEPQRQRPVQPIPSGYPVQKKSGGKTALIIIAIVAAAAIAAAVLFLGVLPRLGGGNGMNHAPTVENTAKPEATKVPADASSKAEEAPAPAVQRYENTEVNFALEYPGGSILNEPNGNNVQILDSQEAHWQVSVEYAWQTAGNSAIYNAEDFHEQIVNDPQVLYDWLGVEDVRLGGSAAVEIAGTQGVAHIFHADLKGVSHSGALITFDGDSDFGCYTFMSLYEDESARADEYAEAVNAIRESLEITGSYTHPDYWTYDAGDWGWQFLLRDSASKGEFEFDSDSMVLYPLPSTYTDCSIWMNASAYDPEDDTPEEALQGICSYYFNYKDRAEYTSRISPIRYGRYPAWEVELQFADSGKTYRVSEILLEEGGVYWRLTMKASESNLQIAQEAAADLIMSLKHVREAAAAPNPTAAAEPTPAPTATPTYNDRQWNLLIDGTEVVHIRMPYAWSDDAVNVRDVSNSGDIVAGLRFSSAANSDYGGHVVTIAIYEKTTWMDLPRAEDLFDIYLGNKVFKVVAIYPTDVQYDYNSDSKTAAYQALSDTIPILLEGIEYYQGS